MYCLEYKISKDDISSQLLELIRFHNIINEALNIYKNRNLDFVDCILCSYSKQDEIITFVKKLNKCIKSKMHNKS